MKIIINKSMAGSKRGYNLGFRKVFLMADVSRHFFQFKLPDGQIKFKTCGSGLLTIVLGMLVLSYAITEFIVVWNRSSYTVLENSDENVLTSESFSFGRQQGFAIAAAFVGTGNLDPEIGQLKFFMKSWASSTEEIKFTDMISRHCEKDDFIESSDAEEGQKSAYGFFPMDDTTEIIVNQSSYQLRCIDSDYEIKGDFNSNAASNLMVTFQVCDPEYPERTGATQCKSKDEIEEQLKASYLLLVENVERYKHQNSPTSGKMFKRETKISWQSLSLSTRVDFLKKIAVTEVKYHDKNLGLGVGRSTETIFQTHEKPSRVLIYDRPWQIAVTFEIDSTYYKLIRMELSYLDWLSSVGGLSTIIFGITQFMGNMESASMFATSSMFYPDSDGEEDSGKERKEISAQVHRPEDAQVRCCLTCKAQLVAHESVPRWCKNRLGNSKDRILAKAHEHVKSSMYIDSLLMQLRTMEGVLREKLELSDADWRKAKRQFGVIKATDFTESKANQQGTIGKVKIGVGKIKDRGEKVDGENDEMKQKKVDFPPSPAIKNKVNKRRQESSFGLIDRKEDSMEQSNEHQNRSYSITGISNLFNQSQS